MPRLADLPTLHGPRVTLRPPKAGETDLLADAIAVDPAAGPRWSTDCATMRRWLAEDEINLLVVELDGVSVGIVDFEEVLEPEYHSAGMDIALLECCTGKGVGGEVLQILGAWLIDVRGHHRLTIDPAADNARAIRSYSKIGYQPIGIARCYERGPDGSWHDNLLMDVLAEEFVRG
ncbi:MAG: GNAT family protein [Coriobacteriia bacterium]|nr:GNAT family protein [Coriobacteriia bacterium]